MKTAVLHAEVSGRSRKDDLDVLSQVKAVSNALSGLGHSVTPVAVSLDLGSARDRISSLKPDFVFNLVESLNGFGRFIYFAPALLDQFGIPYSGSPTHTLYITTSKSLTKESLAAAGLATPEWLTVAKGIGRAPSFPPPYFIKPVWEDASVGIDDESLVHNQDDLAPALSGKTALYGECLVERYIDGREFNLSLLASEKGPEVLPPAEMNFRGYRAGKPRIVNYRAKWDEKSFEFRNTVRSFDFPDADAPLLDEMRRIAEECWGGVFELRGYARVDFRVDAGGRPWVLELNANPCLSPDSGFVAAAERAGLAFPEVVQRIVDDSLRGRE